MKKINDAALENESLTDDLKRMIDKAINLMGDDFIIRGAKYLGVKALVLIEKHLAETMPKTPESPKDKEAEAEPDTESETEPEPAPSPPIRLSSIRAFDIQITP